MFVSFHEKAWLEDYIIMHLDYQIIPERDCTALLDSFECTKSPSSKFIHLLWSSSEREDNQNHCEEQKKKLLLWLYFLPDNTGKDHQLCVASYSCTIKEDYTVHQKMSQQTRRKIIN